MTEKYTKNPPVFLAEQFLGMDATHEPGGAVEMANIQEDEAGIFNDDRCPNSTMTGRYGVIETKLGIEKICPGNYVVISNRKKIESIPEYIFLNRYSKI